MARLSEILARPGPPPKRLAPKRRDALTPSQTDRTTPMGKYTAALDAAPQDGRWLDDPTAVTTVLQFLLSKLSPADMEELDKHLTEGTAPQATDSRIPEGNLKRDFFNYTPRNRRNLVGTFAGVPRVPGRASMSLDEMRRADPDAGKSFDQRFPNHGRLKG